MTSNEKTYLLGRGAALHDVVVLSQTNKIDYERELTREDLEYNTAHPAWISIRLCLFWMFWAVLIAVLFLSIFVYCCVCPVTCMDSVHQ